MTRTSYSFNALWLIVTISAIACSGCQTNTSEPIAASTTATPAAGGQASVQDDDSQKDVVKVAVASKDHTTLVKAVQAAGLVDALSNAGPFTVFAPVNAAFDKLPAGTVDQLLQPEKKADLENILQYHVAVAVYRPESFTDGQVINMVNGSNIKIQVKDGKVRINDKANVIANVPASNGIVYVLDQVLLPE